MPAKGIRCRRCVPTIPSSAWWVPAGVVVGVRELVTSTLSSTNEGTQSSGTRAEKAVVADLYPKNKPQLADLVDGSIGEGSHFHAEFGYYAQGVGPDRDAAERVAIERLCTTEMPDARRIRIRSVIEVDFKAR